MKCLVCDENDSVKYVCPKCLECQTFYRDLHVVCLYQDKDSKMIFTRLHKLPIVVKQHHMIYNELNFQIAKDFFQMYYPDKILISSLVQNNVVLPK